MFRIPLIIFHLLRSFIFSMTIQEDTFYDEDDDGDEDDEEDNDDDDDEIKYANRLKRFRRSCEIALNTDTQGYSIQLPSKSKNQSTIADNKKGKVDDTLSRSARELSAISWGTFCTDGPSNTMMMAALPKEQQSVIEKDNLETITYKIQALDCDKLFDRLNLGFHLLRRKKERLQIILKNLGMSMSSTSRQETQDFDEEDLTAQEIPIERKTTSNNNTQDRNDDEDDNITIDSSDDKSNNKR